MPNEQLTAWTYSTGVPIKVATEGVFMSILTWHMEIDFLHLNLWQTIPHQNLGHFLLSVCFEWKETSFLFVNSKKWGHGHHVADTKSLYSEKTNPSFQKRKPECFALSVHENEKHMKAVRLVILIGIFTSDRRGLLSTQRSLKNKILSFSGLIDPAVQNQHTVQLRSFRSQRQSCSLVSHVTLCLQRTDDFIWLTHVQFCS